MGKDPGLRLKIREEEEWTRPLDHQPDQGVHQPGHHLPELHARLAGDAGSDGWAISRGQNGRMESQHSQDTQVRGNALSFSYMFREKGKRTHCSGDRTEDGEPAQPGRLGPSQPMPLPPHHLGHRHRPNLPQRHHRYHMGHGEDDGKPAQHRHQQSLQVVGKGNMQQ